MRGFLAMLVQLFLQLMVKLLELFVAMVEGCILLLKLVETEGIVVAQLEVLLQLLVELLDELVFFCLSQSVSCHSIY